MNDSYNLCDFLNHIVDSNLTVFPKLEEFRSFWGKYLNKEYSNYQFPTLNEVFPLIHLFNEKKETVFLNIEAFKHVYKTSPEVFVPISSEQTSKYYFSESEDCTCSTKDTPIFAILFPYIKDNGDFVTFAVIDGNHRLSKAVLDQKVVNIYCLDVKFPSPIFFVATRDWLLYHLIRSYYIFIANYPINIQTDDYFAELSLLLSQFCYSSN